MLSSVTKMSGGKKMMVRVQSAEGTARLELLDTDVTAQLFERVHDALRLTSFAFALHKDRQRRDEVTSSKSRRLRDVGLQHGDMLYLSPINGAVIFEPPSTSADANIAPGEVNEPTAGPSSASSAGTPASGSAVAVNTSASPRPGAPSEDDVDILLYQLSGNIQRQRDEKLCRHNSKGCCVHCSPLEPWDEGYLKKHNIKHMSFHAYLRKITSGNFISLDELSCKIKPGCKEHPPWPRGICSKCQPSAVTLNRQPYRHVDNVLVEHPALVERFLAYWRATGHQRIGFLYGHYERHPDVPLGVRARVAAIYEPPQWSSRDSIQLQHDPREDLLRDLTAELRLRCVGWLFTDLLPDDVAAGTVQHIRGVDTHFLSAQECIMAGHYQNKYPNACRYASSGYFGSKFVTVCVTGDSDKAVHMEGYQVSGQCQALVRDLVLLPTRDAPDLGYIRDSTDTQYVPDVYYKERDSYGNEVGVSARRVPVAYLLVDVPCGVATASTAGTAGTTGTAATAATSPVFSPRATFPPANRPLHDQLQTLRHLHDHLRDSHSFLEAVSDLHVLLYLASNETLPLSVDTLRPLLRAVRLGDARAAQRWRTDTPAFATLEHLARAAAEHEHDHHQHQHQHQHEHRQHEHDRREQHEQHEQHRPAHEPHAAPSPAPPGDQWTCQLCTYHNAPRATACDMCAMPRSNTM